MDIKTLLKTGNIEDFLTQFEREDFFKPKALLFVLLIEERKKLSHYNPEEMLISLMKTANIKLNFRHNILLRECAKVGWTKAVSYLLTQKKITPFDLNSQSIILAAENGHLNIVNILVNFNNNKKFFYSLNNCILSSAFKNNHIDICELLLNREDFSNILNDKHFQYKDEILNSLKLIAISKKINSF